MARVAMCLTLALLVTGCAAQEPLRPTATALTDVRTIAVVVPTDGTFIVIRERARATATPALLFGVAGAAVAAAHNKSADDGERDKLALHVAGLSSRTVFIESFRKAIAAEGMRTVTVLGTEPDAATLRSYDGVLRLVLHEWGLRLAPAAGVERMAPFVEVRTTMVRTKDATSVWDEREVILGPGRHELSALHADHALVRAEITDTLERAGLRVGRQLRSAAAVNLAVGSPEVAASK